MSVQLKIGNENYYIDFKNIETVLSSSESGFKGGMITETKTTEGLDKDGKSNFKTINTKEYHKSKEVDGFRYETIRTMIDILLTTEDTEDVRGSLEKQPLSFKLAFNTLIEYGILNIAE